jgi:hypothetical protein
MVTSTKEKKKQKDIYRLFLLGQNNSQKLKANLLLKKKIGH